MRIVGLLALLLLTIAFCRPTPAQTGFSSCEQAEQQPGVELPLTPSSVGWNPQLDTDHDGSACE